MSETFLYQLYMQALQASFSQKPYPITDLLNWRRRSPLQCYCRLLLLSKETINQGRML